MSESEHSGALWDRGTKYVSESVGRFLFDWLRRIVSTISELVLVPVVDKVRYPGVRGLGINS